MAAEKRKKKLLAELFCIFECLITYELSGCGFESRCSHLRLTTLLILPDHMEDC